MKAVQLSDSQQRLLNLAQRQGFVTLDDLAKQLPSDGTVEDTLALLDTLERQHLPVRAQAPIPVSSAPGLQQTLGREEEAELARRIQRGRHRSLRAAARAPATIRRLLRAADQVRAGSCSPWSLLHDFESSEPEQDEDKAVEKIRGLAELLRTLQARRRELWPDRRTRLLTRERFEDLAGIEEEIARELQHLDLRDTFLDRLLRPLRADAARLEVARERLRHIEREAKLPQGDLGDFAEAPERMVRRRLKATRSPAGIRRVWLAQFKRARRDIGCASRRAGLPPRDLAAVGAEIRAGGEEATAARNRLLTAHQKLVMTIARRYPARGLDFFDLVQEGNLGLVRAADRFDPERGFRFATYASWWVRQSIGRLLAEQGGPVRIPPHVQEALHKLNRLSRRVVLQTGREPGVEDLARRLNKSPERVREILGAGIRPVSVDAPQGDDPDGASLLDFLPDPHAGPDEEADHAVRLEALSGALSALNPREREILLRRFRDGLTLQEVGEQFGLTRERTRQLQEQAIRRLRQRIRADLLRRLVRDGRREPKGKQ
ncbi:MAG: sigma-70 family RNA polymerase sigma factor [Myxococcales bacterium]|nr:sigma-70 family RNA polymerase sigma factor [Myxococcales bacterium]